MANQCPVIMVHGLFGWGPAELYGFPYWGTGMTVDAPLERHQASLGPVSSSHDRACELAFQIKGGRVDYGAAHANDAGHDRLGRLYDDGFHPDWSEQSPVHLVGHSMGGPTIWMLQHLLAIDFFGWGSNASWVKSLSSISGVLNGSTAAYFLGVDEATGLIREDSIGDFLAGAIELHIRATGDLFDRVYDFNLDHWGIDAKSCSALGTLVERIADSPMFRGKDNAAYSVTIQGMFEQNAVCETNPATYYLSFVTEQTYRGFLSGRHYPEVTMNPFLIPSSLYIGHNRFRTPFYDGFDPSDWWENDGLVSSYSQMYPRIGGNHRVGGELEWNTGPTPGRWYYHFLDGVDHIDIVSLPEPRKIGQQREFYRGLFELLARL